MSAYIDKHSLNRSKSACNTNKVENLGIKQFHLHLSDRIFNSLEMFLLQYYQSIIMFGPDVIVTYFQDKLLYTFDPSNTDPEDRNYFYLDPYTGDIRLIQPLNTSTTPAFTVSVRCDHSR